MRFLATCLAGLLITMAAPSLRAQDAAAAVVTADSAVEVRLKDGSVLIGRVESESPAQVVLMTRSGARVEIPRAEIVSMRRVTLRPTGEVWVEDPNGSRLFFTSTGRSLPQGEGYVSSFWLFFPFVGYGVTDWLTIAAGTPIVPGAFGDMFYIAPKITMFDRGKTSLAVGALSFFVTKEIEEGNVGIVYGVGTYGTRDNAITLGAGWFYAATDGYSDIGDEPVFMIGGERRVSRRVKLVTENWLSASDGIDGMMSGGVRFIGDRLSADLGLASLPGATGCCLPLMNFVWSFGGGK
jgi:hypothetical protein